MAAGLLAGALLALLVQAPASWLAQALARATGQRLLLTDARGTWWSGSARVVLSGGDGSRDARALPGRLQWSIGLARQPWRGLELALQQACCIEPPLRLWLQPGLGRLRVALAAPATAAATATATATTTTAAATAAVPRQALGQWPMAWLAGLGAPFNTLRLRGSARLSAQGLSVEWVQGRWRVRGHAELDLIGLSSGLSPLAPLGSYRLALDGGDGGDVANGANGGDGGDGANGADGGTPDNSGGTRSGSGPAGGAGPGELRLALQTLHGPLRLSGSGQWAGPRLRFRGQAEAEPGHEAMLNNLLNLLGQRQGARALLAIG